MARNQKQVDAVILGGGIAALGVGYALVRRRKKVVFVVPPKPLRGEATPASAGILDPFLESDHLAQPFFRFKKAAFLDFKNQIRKLERATSMDTGFLACGMFFAAETRADERMLKLRFVRHRHSGIPLRWLSQAMIRKEWPSVNPDLRGALFYPTLARIFPGRLQAALKRFVTRNGAEWIAAKGPVRPVVRDGNVAGLVLNRRIIPTERIVNACGSWAGDKAVSLFPLSIEPIRGQVTVLAGNLPAVGPIAHSVRGIYVVPWEKKRYLLGSTVERAGFDPRVESRVLRRIRAAAARLMPGLRSLKAYGAWSGLRPCSQDYLPLIGETPLKGHYVAAGYYRSGIVIGMHAGELLAQGMLDGRMPGVLKPFSPMRRLAKAL